MTVAAPDWNLLFAAALATATASFTPGPNNTICATIGATHGFRRAIPFACGVAAGFPLLLGAAGVGLGGVLRAYPQLQKIAQIGGALFLAYLAYRIITAPPLNDGTKAMVPGFFRAVVFQWINPKSLSFTISLVALYLRPQAMSTDLPLLMLIASVMAMGSTVLWAFAGVGIGRFLKTRRRQKIFNAIMGGLLLLAAADVFRH